MVGLCRWQVFWCDPAGSSADVVDDPVLAGLPSLSEWARRHGTRAGQPFLLRTDGHGVPKVDEFFASPRMRSCKQGTLRKYAFTLATWLGFLDAIECCWHEAGSDQLDVFTFWRMTDAAWRMTDAANPVRVAGGTVRSDLVAISTFYEWARRADRHTSDCRIWTR
jgi:hypothetical protein